MTGKRTTLLFVIALAAGLATGCSNDDGPVDGNGNGNGNGNNNNNNLPRKGTLSGTVVDVMGRPLVNVSVSTTPATTPVLTDSTGQYSIANVPVGSYEVLLARTGFQQETATATIADTTVTTLDADLMETGLVAAYRFDRSAVDVSGSGNDGRVSGALATADRFGAADRAYSFSNRAYIEVPHAPALNFGNSFSIGAWVRLNGGQRDYTGLIAKGPMSTEYPGYMLLIMNGNVAGTATGQPQYVVLTGKRDLNDGGWHYLTIVTDAQRKAVAVYVDGVLERQAEKPDLGLLFDSQQPLLIGVERNRVNYFTGEIDDIRIFNRAITSGEIADLVRR